MSVRRSVDVGRLAASVSRPGIDPRVWLTLASVTDVFVDASENVFVDLVYLPGGEEETAMMGVPYAGANFGAYFPIEIDDTVLVAVPMGDPNLGPVVVARLWSKADPPLAEAQTDAGDGTPSSDVTLRVKAGAKLRLLTSDGGDIQLRVSGSGKVSLGASGQYEPALRGTTTKTWLDTHVHGTPFGPTTPAVTPLPQSALSEKVELE